MSMIHLSLSRFLGIFLSAIYALIIRLIFHFPYGETGIGQKDFYSLFSITFVWITPIIIGVVPLIFASTEQLKSLSYRMLVPASAVLLFFVVCLITGIEDLLCIVVIAFPFLLGAVIGGLFFGRVVEKYRKHKGLIFSFVIIPFMLSPFENFIKTPSEIYTTHSYVVIKSKPDKIWNNIIRVNKITKNEYPSGFFNYAGIPRPIMAELLTDSIGAIRIGRFEGGLVFNETITECERNKKIAFDITMLSSQRQTVFEQHVLRGQHFKFLNASYELQKNDASTTTLILSSTYQLDTKINPYASYWGNILLKDFQDRLLIVIKNRCETSIGS